LKGFCSVGTSAKRGSMASSRITADKDKGNLTLSQNIRDLIERCFCGMKHFTRFATRYDRRTIHFTGFVQARRSSISDHRPGVHQDNRIVIDDDGKNRRDTLPHECAAETFVSPDWLHPA
jgi:hypothetical protein